MPYDLDILITAGLLLFAAGSLVRRACLRVHIPPAVSLMALGLLVGPGVLAWLPKEWISVQGSISKAAFVVLLLRAAFSISPRSIKRILPFALILGTLPVAAELLTVSWISTQYLFESRALGLLAGFLVAAVSPAVILPTMLNQKEAGRGSRHLVPDAIMGQTVVNALWAQAGILLLLGYILGNTTVCEGVLGLPQSLGGGLLMGFLCGWLLRLERLRGGRHSLSSRRRWVLTVTLIASATALYFGAHSMGLESVVAVLAMGVLVCRRLKGSRSAFRADLKSVWGLGEIFLFVNLGSQVRLDQLTDFGLIASILGILVLALAFRLAVAFGLCLYTRLSPSERTYTTLAHLPKATIQAVYGGAPLLAFVAHDFGHLIDDGEVLLMMAVIAIIATAPLGAVLLDRLGARLIPAPAERGSTDDS